MLTRTLTVSRSARYSTCVNKLMVNISKTAIHSGHARIGALCTATCYRSIRRKTYLVGVDGSDYGYSALRAACSLGNKGDKIISMYFPLSIALMMERSAAFRLSDRQVDVMKTDLVDAQQKHSKRIEAKCEEILKECVSSPTIITYCKIGEESFVPRDELLKACYETHADLLVVGAKGLPHGGWEAVTEKITDGMKKITGLSDLTDFAVHNAPCDVMIVKKEHEY